jgi:hypothetical protein
MLAKAVHHDIITITTIVLNVKVETVNHSRREGTGSPILKPGVLHGSERIPEEIGKPSGALLIFN